MGFPDTPGPKGEQTLFQYNPTVEIVGKPVDQHEQIPVEINVGPPISGVQPSRNPIKGPNETPIYDINLITESNVTNFPIQKNDKN